MHIDLKKYLKKIFLHVTIDVRGVIIALEKTGKRYGKVAQLARAFGSYPRGREFESLPC